MIYAGDHRLDVVNMSFFADPFLFNCKNDADQRAIVKAIGRASRYAQQHGVVMVAAQGNEATDLAHPVTDTTSPDFPPGSELTRDVGNNCVVLPNELPGVVGVTGIGPSGELSFFSSYGAGVTDVTAPSGSSGQAPNPFGRVLAAWSSTAPPIGLAGRDVQDAGGAVYAWVQGTSMASPHAAGVAALIRAAHPGCRPARCSRCCRTPPCRRTARPPRRWTAVRLPRRADLLRRAGPHQLLRQGPGGRPGGGRGIERSHPPAAACGCNRRSGASLLATKVFQGRSELVTPCAAWQCGAGLWIVMPQQWRAAVHPVVQDEEGQPEDGWARGIYPADAVFAVVPKTSGTTSRSSLAMGILRRRCGRDGPPDWPGGSCCEHRGRRPVMHDSALVLDLRDGSGCV